jgi:anion-transporting  ArsA/GET3 family ATPase
MTQHPRPSDDAGPPAPADRGESPLAMLSSRRLVVVTGKGGVGKSVVTAALGRLLAAAGRRVLLLEVDPRETLHELTGVAPSGGEVVTVEPRLRLQNLQPRHVFEALVREHVRLEFLVRRVVASPVFQHFVDAAPGLKELAILGHALRVIRGIERLPGGAADLVILDAPATGHGVSMLAAPFVVTEVVEGGPFAYLASELAAFVADAASTAIVVVTLAEEMPVQEALELREALEARVGRTPDLLVVNALYPPGRDGQETAGDAALSLWRERRAINERELARLAARWRGARVELPLVPRDRGAPLVAAIAGELGRILGRPAPAAAPA